MKKEELRKLILTAKGAVEADVVIKNCKVVNVFTGEIQEGDIAISGDQIAGVGQYQGKVEVDAGGRYAAPGFIDSHIQVRPHPMSRWSKPSPAITFYRWRLSSSTLSLCFFPDVLPFLRGCALSARTGRLHLRR